MMSTKNDQLRDPQPAPSAKMNNTSLFKNKNSANMGEILSWFFRILSNTD